MVVFEFIIICQQQTREEQPGAAYEKKGHIKGI